MEQEQMPAMGRLGGTALGKAENPCGNTWVLCSTEMQVLIRQEFSCQLPWECGAQLDMDWDAVSVLSRSKAGREGQEHPSGQMVLLLREGTEFSLVPLGLFNGLAAVCWPLPHWAVSSAILSSVELPQQQWLPGSRGAHSAVAPREQRQIPGALGSSAATPQQP